MPYPTPFYENQQLQPQLTANLKQSKIRPMEMWTGLVVWRLLEPWVPASVLLKQRQFCRISFLPPFFLRALWHTEGEKTGSGWGTNHIPLFPRPLLTNLVQISLTWLSCEGRLGTTFKVNIFPLLPPKKPKPFGDALLYVSAHLPPT